jgi:hypothetical protein
MIIFLQNSIPNSPNKNKMRILLKYRQEIVLQVEEIIK